MLAFRPQDFKSMSKMEEKCQAGLAKAYHLSTPDKISTDKTTVSMQTWIDQVKKTVEERGMDTPFRMTQSATEEHYLLEQFGRADVAKVATWVQQVRTNGCEFDEQNLKMSGKMLLDSLDLDMLLKVKNDLPGDATGPEVFAAVIGQHQSLNTSAVRVLTEQLQKLQLSKEPAEDVEAFSQKVLDIAQRIRGAGPTTCPADLPTLVYECYQHCSTSLFSLDVSNLLSKANKGDPSVDDWETEISKLKSTYRALITRQQWEAKKHHKEKVEVQALQATIKTLQKSVAELGKRRDGKGSSNGKSGEADSRECFHCGKKGHIKPNCPDKDKPKVVKTGSGGSGGTSATLPANGLDRKKGPKDGDPHTKKDKEGVHWKWCGTCKRWSKGEKAHLTDEHVKGKGKADSPPAAAGGLAEVDPNDNSSTLRLVSGYMMAQLAPVTLTTEDTFFCEVCKSQVTEEGGLPWYKGHKFTLAHRDEEERVQIAQVESIVSNKEPAAEEPGWTRVTGKGRKKARVSDPLKDSAGQP
jgi:hypothetical protein